MDVGRNDAGAFRNFKPSNTRRLRRMFARVSSGAGTGAIACLGDSTTAGHGANTGTNGLVGARPFTPPRRLAELLQRNRVPAQEVGVFGDAAVGSTDYATYDARVVLGTGWTWQPNGPSGSYYANTTTVDPLAFTPGIAFDSITYWYAQNTGYSTFTVDINGGVALETVNAAGAGAIVKRTVACALGSHTINFRRTATGTALFLIGVTVNNSATKAVDVWNLGALGWTVANLNNTSLPWAGRNAYVAMAPDAFIVNIGINDWINATPVATFISTYQALITALAAVSDVILVDPVPRQATATPTDVQLQYSSAISGLAYSNDLPFIDVRRDFDSYEISNPLGLYYNATHPNALGYAAMGAAYYRAII